MAMLDFFINGRHMGRSPCSDKTLSHHLICPQCGELWATLAVSPQFMALGSTAWVPMSKLCAKHPPTYLSPFPGSILPEFTPDMLKQLPMPALKWEYERHLATYERIQNGNDQDHE